MGTSPLPEPVIVSARFTYTLRDWTSFAWTQEPPDLEFLHGEIGVAELGTLPFGATIDPVRLVFKVVLRSLLLFSSYFK